MNFQIVSLSCLFKRVQTKNNAPEVAYPSLAVYLASYSSSIPFVVDSRPKCLTHLQHKLPMRHALRFNVPLFDVQTTELFCLTGRLLVMYAQALDQEALKVLAHLWGLVPLACCAVK